MIPATQIGIVGGGVAGCAAAIALARVGCPVVVFERTEYQQTRIGETLPPRARVLLEELGVWESFGRDGHSPASGSLAAWGSEELYENQFLFNPYGGGWHLDRPRFESRFAQRAEEAGARILRHVRVRSLAPWLSAAGLSASSAPANRNHSNARSPGCQRARLVRRASTRRGTYRLRQAGRGVAFFRAASDLNDTRTMVEAAPDGWWYSAYLPNAALVVAFMSDADLLPRGARALHAFWRQQLEATTYTRRRVDGASEGDVHTTRADSYRMSALIGENWLAVGDAAMAFDPLSSHGLYNAMKSAIEAARHCSAISRGMELD